MPRSAVGNVACLTTDACPTAVSGSRVGSRPVEINHEIILLSFSALSLNHSRRVVVNYKRKYVQEVLVNRLFKFAQEKMWLGELTMTIAVD